METSQSTNRADTKTPKTSKYLPHLAIYDHLPRNIDIFSDSDKYQRWANKVLPRIPSPKDIHSFAVYNSRSEDSILSKQEAKNLEVSPVKVSNHKLKTNKSDSSTLRNRKKVKPGLRRGTTVVKPERVLSVDKPAEHTTYSSLLSSAPVTGSNTPSWEQVYHVSTALSHAFQQMAHSATTPPLPGRNFNSPAAPIATGKPTVTAVEPLRPQKTFISIALPVNPIEHFSSPRALHDVASIDVISSSLPNGKNTTRNKDPKNKKGSLFPTSLSHGMLHLDRKQNTIPAIHEMSTTDSMICPGGVSMVKT